MKLHLSYLSPFCKYNNWKTLSIFLKLNNNLYEILHEFIEECNIPSTLYEWSRIAEKHEFDTKFIHDRIQNIKLNSKIVLSDMSVKIRKDAVNSLKKDTSFHSRESILTAVSLNSETCSNIILELGHKYDLFKMINTNKIEQEIYQLVIHETLLTVLQKNGFSKIGLLRQEPLDINNKSKWSLKSIEQALKNQEEIKEALIGYKHLIKVQEIIQETNNHKKSKLIQESLLQRNDYNKFQNAKERLEQTKSKMTLDDWQKDMINHIQAKHNLLVKGPTSGGKTFASMAAINWLINTDGSIKLLYCAPTDHLCMQTWANISKTFDKQKVALVCGIFANIPENANIWIGTPIELYSYIQTINIKFQIAIFDEVHTLSTSFSESLINTTRSEAMAKMLGYVTEQIIVISATIHDADIPVLKNFVIQQSKLSPIYEVVYTERPVPITKYFWNGENYMNDEIKITPVTSQTTFELILKLKHKKNYPALIFDENEENCFNNFSDLVDWLDEQENTKSREWITLRNFFDNDIRSLNSNLYTMSEEWAESQSKNEINKNSLKPKIKALVSRKILLVNKIKNALIESMKKCSSNDKPIDLTDNEIKKFKNYGIEKVTPLIYYLGLQIPYYEVSTDDNLDPIPIVCQGAMPYYRIGNHHSEAEAFRSIRENNKLRNQILHLCKAERIRENEIRPLFDLIIRGLEYGIGIILPTMPFVVQYEMLKLINARKIEIVFVSESMSMGINFPINTVVIRSEFGMEHNVCELLQMEGRAGRRGLDKVGHVIFWNITNALVACLDTLPRITLPKTDENCGSLVLNPLECAIDIECQRVNITDTSFIDEAIGKLSLDISEEINKTKKKKYNLDLVDDRIEYTESLDTFDGEIIKPKVEKIIKSNVNDQDLASSIIGCIGPVMKLHMNMSAVEIVLITHRIQQITVGNITEDIKDDSYKWAQIINNVKKALQEIHTYIRLLPNIKLTKYIASIYELLHRIQYRQMRI